MAGRARRRGERAPRHASRADNLPPREAWPELRFDLPELRYPARLNAAVALLDAQRGGRPRRPPGGGRATPRR